MAEAEAVESSPTKKTEYIQVEMTDGRKVDFPTKTKAKKDVLEADGKVTGVRFDFANGQTRTILLEQVLPLIDKLAAHGISQKCGDSYASEKDVDDAVMAFDDTADNLLKGIWSEQREGGGFGGASVLAKALCEYFKIDMEQCKATLKTMSPKEKLALRQADGIREIVVRLESEKAKDAGVDTSALMGKFAAAA